MVLTTTLRKAARLLMGGILPIVALALVGIREDAPTATPGAATLLRDAEHYDFEPFVNPEAMRRAADVAVLGSVSSVTADRINMGPEDIGVVLIELKASEAWKGTVATAPVTVVVRWPKDESVGPLAKELPIGTKMAFFGSRAARPLKNAKTAAAFEPIAQGLMIETPDGRFDNVWGHDVHTPGWDKVADFGDLRAALTLTIPVGLNHFADFASR